MSIKITNARGQVILEYALSVVLVVMIAILFYFWLLPVNTLSLNANQSLAEKIENEVRTYPSNKETILERIFRKTEEVIIAPGP